MTGALPNLGNTSFSFFLKVHMGSHIQVSFTVQLPELQPNLCQKSRAVGTCTDLPEWHKNILANVDIVLLGGFKQIHLQITIMDRWLNCRLLNSDNFFFQKLT